MNTSRPGTVYLLHFDQPYRHARHYTGWTADLPARLQAHAAGHGARLMEVIKAAGITWQLARTWEGGRDRERQLKQQGGASRHCPSCGVKPRHPEPLPRNRDGSVSRSRSTDAQKGATGLMTSAQQAEHTALRRGLVTGKPSRPAERGPLGIDPWALPAPRTAPDREVDLEAG